MQPACMHLEILLPFRIFAEVTGVLRIVATTTEGAYGLLPHRLDCVASLSPGLLVFETSSDGEVCMAVDEGILVKAGFNVRVSVRNAVRGLPLDKLYAAIEQEFVDLDEQEKRMRSALAKLESGFMRRFATLHHE